MLVQFMIGMNLHKHICKELRRGNTIEHSSMLVNKNRDLVSQKTKFWLAINFRDRERKRLAYRNVQQTSR